MRNTSIAVAASAALLSLGAGTASAQSVGCVLEGKDAAFDNTTTLNPSAASPTLFQPSNALDLRGLTLRYDALKGTTASLRVTNLSRKIPAGSTSTVWTVQWAAASGTVYFVRAVNDLADNLVFEWGELVPPVVGNTLPRYEYRGATAGRFLEGENGLIEITVPPHLAAPGMRFTDIYAQSNEGRQVVPNAVATPTRGLSSPSDRLPDGRTDFVGPWLIQACPAPAATASATGKATRKRARSRR